MTQLRTPCRWLPSEDQRRHHPDRLANANFVPVAAPREKPNSYRIGVFPAWNESEYGTLPQLHELFAGCLIADDLCIIGSRQMDSCRTAAALEAAHIRISDDIDDNDPINAIFLLRADIHAPFDALLITFTPDGKGIELSAELLTDPTYDFLRRVEVAAPVCGPKSSSANIGHHCDRFGRRAALAG